MGDDLAQRAGHGIARAAGPCVGAIEFRIRRAMLPVEHVNQLVRDDLIGIVGARVIACLGGPASISRSVGSAVVRRGRRPRQTSGGSLLRTLRRASPIETISDGLTCTEVGSVTCRHSDERR